MPLPRGPSTTRTRGCTPWSRAWNRISGCTCSSNLDAYVRAPDGWDRPSACGP